MTVAVLEGELLVLAGIVIAVDGSRSMPTHPVRSTSATVTPVGHHPAGVAAGRTRRMAMAAMADAGVDTRVEVRQQVWIP